MCGDGENIQKRRDGWIMVGLLSWIGEIIQAIDYFNILSNLLNLFSKGDNVSAIGVYFGIVRAVKWILGSGGGRLSD
jgi:hypothetical protein